MSDNTLNQQERELFRDNFRKFPAKEVEPHYQQWEKDEIFPRELWR
ncbi:MAG: acyl-CoA dehydrogenase family protein [Ketobacter sp.]